MKLSASNTIDKAWAGVTNFKVFWFIFRTCCLATFVNILLILPHIIIAAVFVDFGSIYVQAGRNIGLANLPLWYLITLLPVLAVMYSFDIYLTYLTVRKIREYSNWKENERYTSTQEVNQTAE